MSRGRTASGFTLVEVMLALAILFGGLVLAMQATAKNIRTTTRSELMGVATDLARGKMYDLEEELLREGFQELDQELDGDFSEESWPRITWHAVIEKVKMPSKDALSGLDGDSAAEGSDGAEGLPPGAPLGLPGSEAGGDPLTGGFIASQFGMFQQILEAAIRRVTLTVKWSAGGDEDELVVVAYFTDPTAISLGGVP